MMGQDRVDMVSEPARPFEVFRLQGRAVTRKGAPIAGLDMAVFDRDRWRHDLLGVGMTGRDGTFRLSFTRAEFNQELLEDERLPDVEIVFSARIAGQLGAIEQCALPHNCWTDPPVPQPEPVPRFSDRTGATAGDVTPIWRLRKDDPW